MTRRYSLGVDLGTTYSAAAVADGERVEVVTLGTVAPAIPSVVVLRSDGEVLVGEAAERRALSEPTRTAREFKRRLGDPAPLVLGGTPYGAEALMAHLLRAIVQQVSGRQGGPPARIVVTHPANYGAYKKDLLNEMIRLADVGEVGFLTEPEAAAGNYAQQDHLEPGQVVAVYDFGGGTFDAAILRKTADGFEILGTPEGMERLGGIDFDQAIFAHVNEALGGLVQELDAGEPAARAALARLRADCRAAKEALSSDTDTAIPVMLPNVQTEVRLTRPEFEQMIRPRIRETVDSLKRALRSAGTRHEDVSRILLVGGTSRIPLVAELVRQEMGRPVAVDADPKFAIALGAARHGWRTLEAEIVAEAAAVELSAAGEPTRVTPVAAALATGGSAGPPPIADGSPLAAPRPSTGDGSSSRRVAGILILAVILLLVAGVAAFALMGGPGPDEGGVAQATASPATQPAGDSATTPTGPAEGQTSAPEATGQPAITDAPATEPAATVGQATEVPPTEAAGTVSPTDPGSGESPLAATEPPAAVPVISTVAGTGLPGYSGDGGPARVAQLGRPAGLAVGPDGELYIVDQNNTNIRVVRDGTIETFVEGGLGFARGAAIDEAGNLYVADTPNARIVRFDRQGEMTTVAGGTGDKGPAGDGGPAVEAQLWDPRGVALDATGNLYIADTRNHRIRRVGSDGTISTVAGTGGTGFSGDGGPAVQATLTMPSSVAVDAEGTLYIADMDNGRIRRVGTDGTITTIAGNGGEFTPPVPGAPATDSSFFEVSQVAVDPAGNVYADPVRRLVRIRRDGSLELLAGGGTGTNREDDGIPASEAGLGEIWGIAVDPTRDRVYLSIYDQVREISAVPGMD